MSGISPDMFLKYFIRLLVLFTAMPVHECAHGIVADRLGDETPRRQGRLTLNPFAHLDLMGSLMLMFVGFGWAKPVEVDMRNFKHPRRDMAISSLAGPVSNILLALLGAIVFKLMLGLLSVGMLEFNQYVDIITQILQYAILINVSLAVFNFLPVPPLDGSKIIGPLLPENLYWNMLRYQRQISMALILLLVFHVLDTPILFLTSKVLALLDTLTNPLLTLLFMLVK